MATIRSSGYGEAAVIGGFGGRTASVEWEVRELLHLLRLSASTEDEETASEADAEEDQDDECDKKFHHGRSHGGAAAAAARAVSDDECGDDRHW